MEDLSRLSLSILEDISRGIDTEMQQLYYAHTPAHKALEKMFRHTDTHYDLIPETGLGLLYNTVLKRHLGSRGIISPCRAHNM